MVKNVAFDPYSSKFWFQNTLQKLSVYGESKSSQIFLKGGSLAAVRGVQRESR
jgi:hypothetical protein